MTNELLYYGAEEQPQEADVVMVEQLCNRLPKAAQILANRSRKDKTPYLIEDEYDVQD